MLAISKPRPLPPHIRPAAPTPDEPSERTHERLRILVVEDEPETLALTIEVLEHLGHWATGVKSAEIALDRFIDGAFDALIVDVGLPALSGVDLAEKLRERNGPPIVFASGASPSAIAAPGIWLQKPYSIGQLQDALDQVSVQKRQPSEPAG